MAAIGAAAGAIARAIAVMRAIMPLPFHVGFVGYIGVVSARMIDRGGRFGGSFGMGKPVGMAMRGSRRRPKGDSHQHHHGQKPAHAAFLRSYEPISYRLVGEVASDPRSARPT